MRRKITDEELDVILERLLEETSATDVVLKEVEMSPTLWRGIRNEINESEANASKGWLTEWQSWLGIGLPLAAAMAFAIFFMGTGPKSEDTQNSVAAVQNSPQIARSRSTETESVTADPGSSRTI